MSLNNETIEMKRKLPNVVAIFWERVLASKV
jgi:hypothetical protein